MAKEPIKEIEKKTHKLQIEATVNISEDGVILIETDEGEVFKLSTLMTKFNGNRAKIAVSEDFETELAISEDETDEDN